MKKILILTFVVIIGNIVLDGCFKKTEMPPQYKIDNDNFKQSIISLNKAMDLSNPPGSENQQSFELSKEVKEKIFSNIEEGIKLGKQVSDDYLDFLHLELKDMFKNRLIKGTEIYYDGLIKNDSGNITEGARKQIQGDHLISEWLDWWNKNGKDIAHKVDRVPSNIRIINMSIIIFIIGLVGLFGFSQIIYPLFFAFPKIKKLQKEGKLKRHIPLYTVLLAPIIWAIIIIGSILIVQNYFSNYQNTYLITLGTMLVVVIAQIPKKNKDLEVDFMETWKNYFKG